MATALDRIIEYKYDEVEALKRERSLQDLLSEAKDQDAPRGFRQWLTDIAEAGENALICEMKRKSPSAGDILPGADPRDIAAQYERGGAACLSVLTDGPSFGGSLEDFRAIRSAVSLPMLRKDFMVDTIQVVEARANGADAILVILSSSDDPLAMDLTQAALDLGMDALIETHDEAELERALKLPSPLIGINNRDLKIMKTDLATSERLSQMIPITSEYVSESGISEPADIVRLRHTGARRFLIGESLMKRPDREQHVQTLRQAK